MAKPEQTDTTPQTLNSIQIKYAVLYQDALVMWGDESPQVAALDKELEAEYEAAIQIKFQKFVDELKKK
jgi:hypothetical protein